MKGFIFKALTVYFAIFSTSLFASTQADLTKQMKVYNAKMGCMTCHQGSVLSADEDDDTDGQDPV